MDNWIAEDQKYVWHPFTQEKSAPKNIAVESAKGAWIKKADGEEMLDFISSWWVNTHGHSHPYLNRAIQEQMEQIEHIIFAGFTHPKAVELSKRLIGHLGGHFAKVFFSDNGSTANEVALKMALQYFYNHQKVKPKVIALNGSYHGDTFGAMSTGTRNEFNQPFAPNLFDVYHVDPPTKANFKEVKAQFKSFLAKGDVAAFVFEPLLMGVAGMQCYDADCLDELIVLAKQSDVITIADEVFTGFYRTGTMFAIQQIQEQPDIICLSKGLTAGYLPLGLSICTHKIYDAFYSDDRLKTFFHGHSFTGNPLSCAVACASLDLFEREEIQKNIQLIIGWNKAFKKELSQRSEVGNIRQMGTILAFDLNSNEATSYFNTMRDHIYEFFLDRNILLRPLGNTVYFSPPYCINHKEYKIAEQAVRDLFDYLKN